MMPAAIYLTLLSVFLLGWTTFAMWYDIEALVTVNAALIICIPLLGASAFSAFGYAGNVGNIFFVVGMHGISLKYAIAGARAAYRSITGILFASVLVLGSILILQAGHILSPLVDSRIQIAGARIISLCMVQPAFVYLLERPSHLPFILRVPLISVLMQVIDCLLFFPDAFLGVLPPQIVLGFALSGFATRLAVTALTVPFLAFSVWLVRPGAISVV
jgi:hypothetical protein